MTAACREFKFSIIRRERELELTSRFRKREKLSLAGFLLVVKATVYTLKSFAITIRG
jgi:hypothetical protein